MCAYGRRLVDLEEWPVAALVRFVFRKRVRHVPANASNL